MSQSSAAQVAQDQQQVLKRLSKVRHLAERCEAQLKQIGTRVACRPVTREWHVARNRMVDRHTLLCCANCGMQVSLGGLKSVHLGPDAPSVDGDSVIVEQAVERMQQLYGCRIVLAADVGSRCWGYHRAGSDYDVHMLFVPHPSVLLGISGGESQEHIKHTFEFSNGQVNLSGFSLRRALRGIAEHSTSTELLELLGSDRVYATHAAVLQPLAQVRQLANASCSVRRCVYALVANFDKNFKARVAGCRLIPGKYYLQYARMLLYARYVLATGKWPEGHQELMSACEPRPLELTTLTKWRQSLQVGQSETIRRNVRIEMWLLLLRRRCMRAARVLPTTVEGDDKEAVLSRLHREVLREVWMSEGSDIWHDPLDHEEMAVSIVFDHDNPVLTIRFK